MVQYSGKWQVKNGASGVRVLAIRILLAALSLIADSEFCECRDWNVAPRQCA
jgi:hypothetical protein